MSGRSILLIDDDPMMCELFSLLLRPQGFQIASATNPQEARARLAIAVPDVVLLDLNLGGADGLELIRELRDALGERVPLVVVSASSDSETRERVGLAGATAFLAKPVNPRTFAADLEPYLRTGETSTAELDPRERKLRELRAQFLETALDAIDRLQKRSDEDMFSDTLLADAAHKWIGASSIEGMPDVETAARAVEALARAQRVDQALYIRHQLQWIEEQFRASQRESVAA